MTILRMLDEFKMVTVAAPAYLARNPEPAVPDNLQAHNCILYRWDGAIQPWLFNRGGQQFEVAVEGSFTVNDIDLLLLTALEAVGIALMPQPIAAAYIADGRLMPLLQDWSRTLPGVFIYHPSRRQVPAPLGVFLKFIERWRTEVKQGKRLIQIETMDGPH
jgi:DNA-binding transcriptional LysR family regulator